MSTLECGEVRVNAQAEDPEPYEQVERAGTDPERDGTPDLQVRDGPTRGESSANDSSISLRPSRERTT